ncbi:MAG: serine/threonine-protein kinase, partial [Acidobacteriota bacterium]
MKPHHKISHPAHDEDLGPTTPGGPASRTLAATAALPNPIRPPEVIGPYRILNQLGEGGMGVVYLAEQTEPVRRRVALKMLRSRLPHRQLQVRFAAEQQAMARLHHPNIAQLYEAGSTSEGLPYFVMEWVDGVPITEYCDRERLGIRRRLELFQAVCGAVQHAHEKGLLHRDLKPSNILVYEEHGRAIPKVLDFGIAKSIDQPLVEGTLFTGERVIGTPAYLSPEAVSPADTGIDIDTRSDVYSLGILLYELLVGVRPFEPTGISVVKVLRQIIEEEPAGPSVKWAELEQTAQFELAHARALDAGSLAKRLRGELDWIVLKAVAKDRQERYASATHLAADLERHLRQEPVEAGPPSMVYRVRKFVRRQRGLVTAAALLLLTLILGLTGTLVNLQRATQEAERASREAQRANQEAAATQQALEETEEISEFLQRLFKVSDPGEARGNTVTARELLDQGAEKIRAEFENRPLTRARFMLTIGEVYESLGLFDQAEPLLEEALTTREAELDPDHPQVAGAVNSLGRLRFTQGQLDEADVHFRRALEIRERTLPPDHPDLASSLNHLAFLLTNQGRYDEAEPLHLRGLEIEEKVLGPNHPSLVMGLTTLG